MTASPRTTSVAPTEAERERERKATELEARQARKLRRAVIAASIFAVMTAVGWGIAIWQNGVVEQGAILEKFRHIADQSGTETGRGDAGTGLLLALEALPDKNSEESRRQDPSTLARRRRQSRAGPALAAREEGAQRS